MPVSSAYGDSDDDALIQATQQHTVSQVGDEFESSPRATKRQRTDAPSTSLSAEADEEDYFGDDVTLFDALDEAELANQQESPKRKQHLLHQPRIQANLERIILTQTQVVPQSQPWEIRGPIWKKPRPKTPSKANSIATFLQKPAQPVGDKSLAQVLQSQKVLEARPNGLNRFGTGKYDAAIDLENLPLDAFNSSNPEENPEENPEDSGVGFGVRAPLNGLRQTTLFGRNGAAVAQSQVNKRHNWPLANKDEPPTHHKIDPEAMKTWVYPTNIGKIRDYQFNIVHRGLFHNLLVALPTGLGKTFIAATVILNWYRWTKDAQIVFVAPTKPLVAQQVEACFNIAGIPRSQTTMLTGEVQAGLRAEEWERKRVFFMTPQTLINDLKVGTCDPKRIVLVVIDEAHRATGGYAYVEVIKFIRRFNENFRILALTATPGGDVEAVQKVIDGLDISRCEIRTEQSLDIREYVHQKEITKQVFEPDENMELLFDWFTKATQPVLDILTRQNAYWLKDPRKLTRYGLLQAQQKFTKSDVGRRANQGVKGMVASAFKVLMSLSFALEFLKYYSIKAFYDQLLKFRAEARDPKTKSKYKKQVDESEPFERMMVRLKAWFSDPDFVGHPKLEQVRAEVLQHMVDAGEGERRTNTRIEIFSQYRESVEEICRVLKKDGPIVRPHVFVGQATSEKSEGMSQKKQLEVTSKFKSGEYNVLVSTQVGEEGLDIGELDLIICYDSKSSPIRLLQRMGRTGRKREGRVIWLQMKGKEQDDAIKAMDNYEKMQELIADGGQFQFHDDRSRRMVPKEIQPVVDKRVVEIPIENTQRTPSDFLPVPSRKGRGRGPKRPAKKFHMPDGVVTGFTRASGRASDDEGPQSSLEESVPVPTVDEVSLSSSAMDLLNRQYLTVEDDGVGDEVGLPSLEYGKFAALQCEARKTGTVLHGSRSLSFVGTMKRIGSVNEATVQQQKQHLDEKFLEPEDVGKTLVADKYPSRTIKIPKAPPKPRGRPPGSKNKATSKVGSKAAIRTNKTASKRSRADGSGLSDMEAEPSSAPGTSPYMRVRSQAITLGSRDSSDDGDMQQDDGYVDSELEDFVVDDDAPLSQIQSSLPSLPSISLAKKAASTKRRGLGSQTTAIASSQELPDLTAFLEPTAAAGRGAGEATDGMLLLPAGDEDAGKRGAARRRKRRIVSDEEEDGL